MTMVIAVMEVMVMMINDNGDCDDDDDDADDKMTLKFLDLPEGRCRHGKLRAEIPEKVR